MSIAWVVKRILLCKTPLRQKSPLGFDFFSSAMGWSLIAIALLIVLTIPFSHYPALSIKKFFSRFLQQIFLMYLVTEIIHSRKRLYGVLSVLLVSFCLVALDIMIQYFSGVSVVHHTRLIFGRVSGPMNHPNDLGTLLVSVLPVILVLIIISPGHLLIPGQKSKRTIEVMSWACKGVIWALFFLLINALGFTASRGAWVAFALSVIALGFFLKSRNVMILIILILTVFFGVYGVYCLNTRIDMYNVRPVFTPSMANPLGLPAGENAFEILMGPSGREFYWGTAAGVIKHYPLFGCGYSAYVQTLKDLHVGHEEYPHNSLLHITAELGFLGLILYGWFFTALFLQIKNTLREVSRDRELFLLGCGLTAGIMAWMIHSLMDTAWTSLQLSDLWWLFIGFLLSLRYVLSETNQPPVGQV